MFTLNQLTGFGSNNYLTNFGNFQSFTSDDTFETPPGVSLLRFKLWGAGGASGSGNVGFGTGARGGAGGYAQGIFITSPGLTFNLTVGLGGMSAGEGGNLVMVDINGNPLIIAGSGGCGGSVSNQTGPTGVTGGVGGEGGGLTGVTGGNPTSGAFNSTGGGGGNQITGGLAGTGDGGHDGLPGTYLTGGVATELFSGGGGYGYYGGGSSGSSIGASFVDRGAGGGGGSNYLDILLKEILNLQGSGITPPNTGDAQYDAIAGIAGDTATASFNSGNRGLIVIEY